MRAASLLRPMPTEAVRPSSAEMARRIEQEDFLWGGGDAREFFEVLFNVAAFLFFVLLLQNLIIGITFDQFAGMRNNDAEMREDAATCCLVCSLSRSAIEEGGVTWREHVEGEHAPLEGRRVLAALEAAAHGAHAEA